MIIRFLGKMFHVIKCAPGARNFLNRLTDKLKCAHRSHDSRATLDNESQKDLAWLSMFLEDYNGMRLLPNLRQSDTIKVDACTTGAGAWT